MIIHTVGVELAKVINSFKRSGTRDTKQWLRTFQAAMYCADKTARFDIDWNNLLLENRRYPYQDGTDDPFQIVHGNTNRFAWLPNVDMKRKFYYAQHDLDEWIANIIKANLLSAPQTH